MNAEEEQFTAFVISPSWCQTELGNRGARAFGMEQAPIGVEDSGSQMVQLIDGATKESHSGRLWGHDSEQQTW